MKTNFWKATGEEGQLNEARLLELRLNKVQYRKWCMDMNAHNKAKGRWVDDERVENKAEDFIDRMYKIMNTQSKALDQLNEDGTVLMEHEFTKERSGCEGVSLGDFKKTMIPWLRKFCELKDNDNL